jgi:hypothetical protein
MEAVFWILISALGTRGVFRKVIPARMPHPSFERYIVSWIAISIWWYFVYYLVSLISTRI